ncbi:dipeptidase PepE [Thalassotalea fusca]
MTEKQLLLLSSSRVGSTEYLSHALPMISEHLNNIKEILFVPFAGVTISYDEYLERVQNALSPLDITVKGLHQFEDKRSAIQNASAILVGGGNTFHLLHELYKYELVDTIREQVNAGTPYIGWSAGSNIAGLSIKTTNDMPIIEPPSFDALKLVNVQLNPHYTDFNPPGFNGETREQRLAEFMVVNSETPIIGIVEGTALKVTGEEIKLIGGEQGFVFKGGNKTTVESGSVVDHLL